MVSLHVHPDFVTSCSSLNLNKLPLNIFSPLSLVPVVSDRILDLSPLKLDVATEVIDKLLLRGIVQGQVSLVAFRRSQIRLVVGGGIVRGHQGARGAI